MRIQWMFGISLAALLMTSAAATNTHADPGTDDAHIIALAYGGTGCPAGSIDLQMDSAASWLTVTFNRFLAQTGPNVALSESRKNCQMNLLIHVPTGMQYAVTSIEQHGFAALADGVDGMVKNSYYFQGQAPTSSKWRVFHGPGAFDWDFADETDFDDLVWSPCNVQRSLNINAQLQIRKGTSSPDAESFMTLDSEHIDQTYHLVWRACN